MPIKVIKSEDVVGAEKGTTSSKWPNRKEGANRIEPVATPKINSTFKFKKDSPIFTIGSCFARNVEAELARNGYIVPMQDLDFSIGTGTKGTEFFNNYGVASIYNELAWATGEKDFDPDLHLYQVGENKYLDLHLTSVARPASLDDCLKRRESLKTGFGTVAQCSMVIITLGLIEIWFDKQASCYLNISPPRNIRKKNPDRFELHVLSHKEVLDGLFDIYKLLDKYCIEGYKSLLTVSPVPLALTYTDQDVAVANMYSKSTLRSAAAELVESRSNVDYFPSYESIMLTDRSRAWQDDLRHPTLELIKLNVGRVISEYGDHDDQFDIETIGNCIAEKEFRRALVLAEKNLEQEGRSEELCQLLLKSSVGLKDVEKTREYYDLLFPDFESTEEGWSAESIVTSIQVSSLLNDGDMFSAMAEKVSQIDVTQFTLVQFRAIIKAAFDFGNYDVCSQWCEAALTKAPRFAFGLITHAKLYYAAQMYTEANDALQLFLELENDPVGEGEKLKNKLALVLVSGV